MTPFLHPRGNFHAHVQGCYARTHFCARYYSDQLVRGWRGETQVIGTPKNGCAFWQRKPGADDQ